MFNLHYTTTPFNVENVIFSYLTVLIFAFLLVPHHFFITLFSYVRGLNAERLKKKQQKNVNKTKNRKMFWKMMCGHFRYNYQPLIVQDFFSVMALCFQMTAINMMTTMLKLLIKKRKFKMEPV